MKCFEFIVRPAYREYAVLCIDGAHKTAKVVFRGSEEDCNKMISRIYRAGEVLQLEFSGELECELVIAAI